jgi:NADH-quinone oxidoreductase E subunit
MISEDVKAQMREICARYPMARSGMLACLHLAQATEGYITEDGMAAVAEATGTRVDEVDSVVSFYSMYRTKPGSRYVIKVCTSISCYLLGCDALLEHFEERLGIRRGETTADGQFSLQGVECLAACGMAPALQVNEEFVENVTPAVADTMLQRLRQGESLAGMSANWDIAGIGARVESPPAPEKSATKATQANAESPE